MFAIVNSGNYSTTELFDIFRTVYNKIKGKFSILNNNNYEIEEVQELYSNNAIFFHSKYILNSSDNLMDLLDNSEFEEEYYDCYFIKDMASYIFDDEELLLKHMDFIEKVIISFCNILNDKLDILINSKTIEYDQIYQDFTEFFSQQKMLFYTEIYNDNIEYEDLIYKIINALESKPMEC